MTTEEMNNGMPLNKWLLKVGETFVRENGITYIVIPSSEPSCEGCAFSAALDESQQLCGQAPICNSGNRGLIGGDNVHFVPADSAK